MRRSKPVRPRAAATLREAILDGRFDAALWGRPTEDGDDAPRWYATRMQFSIGGSEPYWAGLLYERGYQRAAKRRRDELWANSSSEEIRQAEIQVERNRTLRWETRSQREVRLLRERVESVESKLGEIEGNPSRLSSSPGATQSA